MTPHHSLLLPLGYLLIFGLHAAAAEESSGVEYFPDGYRTHSDSATSWSTKSNTNSDPKHPAEAAAPNPYGQAAPGPSYAQPERSVGYFSPQTSYDEQSKAVQPATSVHVHPQPLYQHHQQQPATSVYNQPPPPPPQQPQPQQTYQQPATSVYAHQAPPTYQQPPATSIYQPAPSYQAQAQPQAYKPATSVYNPKIAKTNEYNPYGGSAPQVHGHMAMPLPQNGFHWEKDFAQNPHFDGKQFNQGFGHELGQKLIANLGDQEHSHGHAPQYGAPQPPQHYGSQPQAPPQQPQYGAAPQQPQYGQQQQQQQQYGSLGQQQYGPAPPPPLPAPGYGFSLFGAAAKKKA